MGQVQSQHVESINIPVRPPESDDESWVYRSNHVNAESGGRLMKTFFGQPYADSPLAILYGSSIKYGKHDCMGERVILEDGTHGPYKFISYEAVFKRVIQFGRGLTKIGVQKGDKIGIYSSNSMWWQTIAFACYSIGAIAVPVYDSLGPQASEYIVNHADVTILCSNLFKFPKAVELLDKVPKVKKLLVMNDTIPQHSYEGSVEFLTCSQVLEDGVDGEGFSEEDLPNGDDLALIMYTSGSTGTPKGCMLSNSNIAAGSAGLQCVNVGCGPGDTFLSFLPLAHIYAQAVELEVLSTGGRVGYARGPVTLLLEDINALQPSILIAVPRVLYRVADAMKAKIAALPAFLQKTLSYIMKYKMECLKQNKPHSLLLDWLLFSKFRSALGGKIKVIVSGGAAIMPEIFEFLVGTITPNILQGCGMTELSSAGFVQETPVYDPESVGLVCPSCEMKLRRVPDMDYDPQDPEEPAGEALFRGFNVFQGYYKQEELTKESLIDGWFASGDIVKITKEKQVRIIDRAKQLVKLSQGEYLSLSALTEAYQLADVCSFIYVHADSKHSEPIAIVWPKQKYIEKWNKSGIQDIENSQEVHDEIVASLMKVFEMRKLRGFERIKHVIVRTDEPTVENGLLTPSMKAQLNKIKAKYLNELNAKYAEIECSK